VTILWSKEACEYETRAKGIYDMIYEAERSEIFLRLLPPDASVLERSHISGATLNGQFPSLN
jgi:hypothetical protein